MEKWRLLKLGEVDAYTSDALNEMLGLAKSREIIGNTLALYRPPSLVWLGRRTSLSHVNVSLCKEKGIPISRGLMAGGVFLFGNQCKYTLVLDKGFFPHGDVAFISLIKCVVKACQILGMPASRRSNDVLVGGRKIVGTGMCSLKDALVFVGSLSLDFDYDLAGSLLRVPAEKFKDKNAKTVSEWVTSARRELGREVSYEEAESALVQGFGDVLGVQFEEAGLTAEELAVLDELEVKYKSESWLKYGKWSPVKEYQGPK